MAFPFGVAGAGVSVIGGLIGGAKAAKGARRLAGAETAIRDLQVARERAATIREAGQALGEQAVNVGGSGVESSSAVTGRATLLTQLASNLNFLNQNLALGRKAQTAQRLIGRGQKIAGIAEQVGDVLGTAAFATGFGKAQRFVGGFI